MDILFENSMAPSFPDADGRLQLSDSRWEYDGESKIGPDLRHEDMNLEVVAAAQSFELNEYIVTTEDSNLMQAGIHAGTFREQSPEYDRSMFLEASTGDEAAVMPRYSGTVRTHFFSSESELVVSEDCDDRDRDTQNQEVATAEVRAPDRCASAISSATVLAGAFETAGPCGGSPSLGGRGDNGWRAECELLHMASTDGTLSSAGDRNASILVPRLLSRGHVTAHRRAAACLTLEHVLALEARLPLPAAAAAIGLSPAELRRTCRRLGVPRWRHRAAAAAAAAAAAPAARTVAYVANLRRRYGGVPPPSQPPPPPSPWVGVDKAPQQASSFCCAGESTRHAPLHSAGGGDGGGGGGGPGRDGYYRCSE